MNLVNFVYLRLFVATNDALSIVIYRGARRDGVANLTPLWASQHQRCNFNRFIDLHSLCDATPPHDAACTVITASL